MKADRYCVLIPTFNNPLTVRGVVENARQFVEHVVVVDDGSDAPGRQVCEQLQQAGLAMVVFRERNGGKGAAVKTGFAAARELGFTHALQMDADGQHDATLIPTFLAQSESTPDALLLAYPVYDETAPALRKLARKFTDFWVNLEAGRGKIRDAMVGFRVYPLGSAKQIRVIGDRMDFDVEIAVRFAWAGVPIVNLPVKVRYLRAEDGGISHFQPLRDNLRFSWLHTKLCTQACVAWVLCRLGITKRVPSARSLKE